MEIKTTKEIIELLVEKGIIKDIDYRFIRGYNDLMIKWIKVDDVIKEWNPNKIYPTDIFPELSIKDLDNIQGILNEHGYRLDNLSANILRKVLKGLLVELRGGK